MAYKKPNFYRKKHCKGSYRSGLEEINHEHLKAKGESFGYESRKVRFTEPAKIRHYTPDFFLKNGIIVETKGMFNSGDRKKHLLVRDQNPDLEIRFVFSNPKAKIYKGSKTTNAMWCEKYGFKWAAKLIPDEWLAEPLNEVWMNAVKRLKK